jgi:hypothetical protein
LSGSSRLQFEAIIFILRVYLFDDFHFYDAALLYYTTNHYFTTACGGAIALPLFYFEYGAGFNIKYSVVYL